MHDFVGSESAAREVERREARRTERKVERIAVPDELVLRNRTRGGVGVGEFKQMKPPSWTA